MNSRTAVWCKVYGHAWDSRNGNLYMNMDGTLFPISGNRKCNRCGRMEKCRPIRPDKFAYHIQRAG